MPVKEKPAQNPGMILVISYAVIYLVNVLVLSFANMYYPEQVVLGTMSMDRTWAILHSMGTLSLLLVFAIPFIHEIEKMKGRELTSLEWMVKYYALNFVGLWIITRFSDQFGLGVTSWMVIAVLAAVLDFFQGMAMMGLEKLRVSKK